MYNYFIFNFNGIESLFRTKGTLLGDTKSIEIYLNGTWQNHLKASQAMMNSVVTGWLDDDDAIDYDQAIQQLSGNIQKAKTIALQFHDNQLYGDLPYYTHLEDVIRVLSENGILPNSEQNIDLHISAWLHDILEDTPIKPELISSTFGEHIYEIVNSVTDGIGSTRSERKEQMMRKLIENQSGIIVKLADRIANIKHSIEGGNKRKLKIYLDEQRDFYQQLIEVTTTKSGKLLLKELNELVLKNS